MKLFLAMYVVGPTLSPFLAPCLAEAKRAPNPTWSHYFTWVRGNPVLGSTSTFFQGPTGRHWYPVFYQQISTHSVLTLSTRFSRELAKPRQWSGVPALYGPLLPPAGLHSLWLPATALKQARRHLTHPSLLTLPGPVKSCLLIPRILSSSCFLKNKKVARG